MKTEIATSTPANKSLHPIAWVTGIALILFSAVGIGVFMGWIPNSMGDPNDKMVVVEPKLANTSVPVRAKAHTAPAPVQIANSARCIECGVIESVREVSTKGEGTGLGAVGGAVVGGVLGNQVGNGRGQDVATVVGVVGGALAGNEVEKRVKTTKSYAVTIRFNDGSSRVINEANTPGWRVGDKVKVINGAIQSNA